MCDSAVIELEKGRHVLIKNDADDVVQGANGGWLIMDTRENTLVYMTPSEELLKFFNIIEDNNSAESNQPCLEVDPRCCSPQPGPSCSASYSTRWERDAILTLITVYKENINNFKSTTMRNEHVWKIVTDKMADLGYYYSKAQIENKFKYLKARYVKKKDNMSVRGTGESPVSFDYFAEFDEIFGTNHNIQPVAIASSSSLLTEECTQDSDKQDKEGPPKKKSRLEKEVSLLGSMFETNEEKKEEAKNKRNRERQQLTQQALSVYEKMMQKLIDKL